MREEIYKNLEKFICDTAGHSGYWYPLENLTIDVPAAAYDIGRIFQEQPGLLESVMRECGIETVIEVDIEAGPEGVFAGQDIFELLRDQREYEVPDLRFWKPRRRVPYYTFPSSSEAYYFDESKTWMIYVSHEGTLTFAGAALTAAAQRIIPDKYLFRGWSG